MLLCLFAITSGHHKSLGDFARKLGKLLLKTYLQTRRSLNQRTGFLAMFEHDGKRSYVG